MNVRGTIRWIAVLLLIFCIAESAFSAEEDYHGALIRGEIMSVDNDGSSVPLHETADKNSDVLCEIPSRSLVSFKNIEQNNFCCVEYDGQRGYVQSQHLPFRYYQPGIMIVRVANCNEYISLRSQPDSASKRIAKIPLGTLLTCNYDAGLGWVSVGYGANYGYVQSKYLVRASGGSMGMNRWVVDCKEFVSLRSNRSASSTRKAKIPLGAQVQSYGSDGTWDAVVYNGIAGYVKSDYLTCIDPTFEDVPVTASLALSINDQDEVVQISDTGLLYELWSMIGRARAGTIGKCPHNGYLVFRMSSEKTVSFVRATDSCNTIIAEDSGVFELQAQDSERFWEIFGLEKR